MLRHASRRALIGAHARTVHSSAARLSGAASGTVPSRAEIDALAAPPGDGPNHRSLLALDGNQIRPYVQPNSFVAPSATAIGSVAVNDRTMVSYNAVVRGDLALIHVGFNSTIGDSTVLSAGRVVDTESLSTDEEANRGPGAVGLTPADAVAAGLSIEPELVVGDYCEVGSNCVLTSCVLEGDNVVGHGCVIEPGARIQRFGRLLPKSVLRAGDSVGKFEVWGGNPATLVETLHPDEKAPRRQAMHEDYGNTKRHMHEFLPVGTAYLEKEALEEGKK